MRLSDHEQRMLDQQYSKRLDAIEERRRKNEPCKDEAGTGGLVGHFGECLRCGAECGERCFEKRGDNCTGVIAP